MASIFVHLAVAKRYIEKNPKKFAGTCVRDFYDGNVLPDLVHGDKDTTHFGRRDETKDLVKRFSEKIGLAKFLEQTNLDNCVERGKLLHLYTDWEYYNSFLPRDYVRAIDLDTFLSEHVYTFRAHKDYLIRKYGLSSEMTSVSERLEEMFERWRKDHDERGVSDESVKILFNETALDEFIERISSVDLDVIAIDNRRKK